MSDNDWLKSQLEKIDVKLDKMDGRLDNLDITSVKQQGILEEHHRRSIANEETIKILRDEFKPIEKHVTMVQGSVKAIAILGTLIAVFSGLLKLLSVFGIIKLSF